MSDCQETYTQPPHGDLPTKWACSNLFTESWDFHLILVLTFYTSQVVTETTQLHYIKNHMKITLYRVGRKQEDKALK